MNERIYFDKLQILRDLNSDIKMIFYLLYISVQTSKEKKLLNLSYLYNSMYLYHSIIFVINICSFLLSLDSF